MNDKMSLIYVNQTGHVIGAVTCNSDPKRQLSVADVATPQFLFEAPPNFVSLSIAATALSVSSPIDFSEAVFQEPARYSVSGSQANSLNATLPTPTLTQTSITITIPAANVVSVPTPVFAQLQETNPATPPPNTLVATGTIAANGTQAILPFASIPSSVDYSILVLVQGYEPFVKVMQA
jgi:hypothetical protein